MKESKYSASEFDASFAQKPEDVKSFATIPELKDAMDATHRLTQTGDENLRILRGLTPRLLNEGIKTDTVAFRVNGKDVAAVFNIDQVYVIDETKDFLSALLLNGCSLHAYANGEQSMLVYITAPNVFEPKENGGDGSE